MGFGEHDILSSEGAQHSKLWSLEFCEAIHPLLMSLHSHVKIGFMDDVTLSGELPTVEQDIITITSAYAETGLRLNTANARSS